jgi:hypothetical protein
VVYTSSDNGVTWTDRQHLENTYGDFVADICSINDKYWLLGTAFYDNTKQGATIFYSSDYGVTWIKAFVSSQSLIPNFILLNDGTAYAFTYPQVGYVLKSNPDPITGIPGIGWSLFQRPTFDGRSDAWAIYGVYSISTGTVIISGKTGVGMVTTMNIYKGSFDTTKQTNLVTSHQASVLSALGIDTTKYFSTILAYNSQASSLGTKLADYYKDPNGAFPIIVPMKYYAVSLGDNVDVEIWRETTSLLGTKKCEVMGISYDLLNATITFNMRII